MWVKISNEKKALGMYFSHLTGWYYTFCLSLIQIRKYLDILSLVTLYKWLSTYKESLWINVYSLKFICESESYGMIYNFLN